MINRHFGSGISYGESSKREILAYIAWGHNKKEAGRLADIPVRAIDAWLLKDLSFRAAYEAACVEVDGDPLDEAKNIVGNVVSHAIALRRSMRKAQSFGLWVQVTHAHDDTRVEVWRSPERCTQAIDKDRSIRITDRVIT